MLHSARSLIKDPKTRFLLLFCLLLGSSFALLSLNSSNRRLVEPFTAGVARAGAFALRLAGEPVAVHGTLIRGQDFAVNIRNGCNGLEAVAIFVAAVLAHPRRNLVAALGGTLAIQLVNVFRVAGLYLVGRHSPATFELAHTVIAQSAMIFFAIALFLAFAQRPRPTRS